MVRPLLAGCCVILTLGVLGAWYLIRTRDAQTAKRAREVVSFVEGRCAERGRLPSEEELRARFPEVSAARGWYYWIRESGTSVHLQYPMSTLRDDAPGTRKLSELTATTYAYGVTIRCDAGDPGEHPSH